MLVRSTLALACMAFGAAHAADLQCIVTSYNPTKGFRPALLKAKASKDASTIR